MNKVILKGNITRDPEMKFLQDGTAVTKLAMATNEFSKDKDGNKKQFTEYHNLSLWGKRAEALTPYFKKGMPILIEGKLRTRSWEGQDGVKRYSTEIIISDVEFCAGKKEGSRTEQAPANPGSDEEIDIEEIPF